MWICLLFQYQVSEQMWIRRGAQYNHIYLHTYLHEIDILSRCTLNFRYPPPTGTIFPWLSTAAFKTYFAANQTKAVYVWLMESFDQIIGEDQLNNVTD